MSDIGKPSSENSFEASLQQLESMVKSMESGQMPLSELVSSYEKGVALLKQCEQQLSAAELRIQTVSKGAGSAEGTPFDPTIA